MPGSWQRLVELFERAVTLPPDVRRDVLEGLDGTDAELRTALERLLAGHEQSAGVLERRELVEALAVDAGDADDGSTIELGTRTIDGGELGVGSTIGAYVLEGLLGEGGMGVVYRARQEEPIRRQVALKLIRVGLGGRELEARFQAERQALAAMDHPGIARVFEAGATESGQPYFVMELAAGAPITTYCDERRLTVRERLELFVEVCDAVQHAHRRGVIHRDLKPSNVLVAEVDGRPQPKVIDFGVAKATDPSLVERTLTHDHRLIGTPEYMSPEQWEATADVDTRTDVYSLAVLLYRLLVGAMPHERRDDDGLAGFVRRLTTEEPPTPSARLASIADLDAVAASRRLDPATLRRRLRGELEWILVRGMARDREERYGSAGELADDVRRHLRGEAIAARPDTLYRLRKLARRHRGPLLAAAAVLLALVAGLVATSLALVEARRLRARAEEEAAVAEAVNDFLNHDLLGAARLDKSGGRDVTVQEILDRTREGLADFTGPPVVEARIRRSLGSFYLSLSDYRAARQLLSEAYRISVNHLGRDHPTTIAAELELGMAEKYHDLDRAEEILLESVEVAERVLGADHANTVRGVTFLANLYTDLGRFEEAMTLLQANLEHWQRIDRDGQAMVARTKSNLATVLMQRGAYDDAIRLLEEAVELFRAALGDEHVHTLQASGFLGNAYLSAGRHEDAELQLRSAIARLEEIVSPDHQSLLVLRANLAATLTRLGRHAEAEALARPTLAGLREAVGAGHPQSLALLRNLGMIVDRQGRSAEAEPILAEAVALARRHLPEGHWYIGAFLGAHGRCLTNLGRYAEAEPALQDGLAILEPAVDPDHHQLRQTLEDLVLLYERWGRQEEAETYRRRISPPTTTRPETRLASSPD